MSQSSEPAQTDGGRPAWPNMGIVALVVAALLVVILALGYMNKKFQIAVDKEGKFTIDVASGANLRDILIAAMASDRASVEEILRARDFYHFTDPKLADALEGLTPDEPEHAAAIGAMRQLLQDQRGPFVMPDTLVGIDTRLIDAFGSLEAKLLETQQTSELLIELWRQSLDYQGIFRTRMFDAKVRRYPGSSPAQREIVVYACPGSDFDGKEVMLSTPDGRNSISGRVVTTDPRHRCGGSYQKLAHLFEGKDAQFGLDEKSYQALFSPDDPAAALEDETNAVFQFLQKGSTDLLRFQLTGMNQ